MADSATDNLCQQVQHCTEHLVQILLYRFGAAPNTAQQRFNLGKLLSTDVACVRFPLHPRIVGGKEIGNTLLEQVRLALAREKIEYDFGTEPRIIPLFSSTVP